MTDASRDGELAAVAEPTPASQAVSERGPRIREEVLELAPLLRKSAPEAERLGALTPEVLSALDAAGVFDIASPIELGGYALGARDTVEVLAAIGYGDGSAAWLVAATTGNNVMALAYPQEAIEEVYASAEEWVGPLLVGASLFATKVGSAREVEGGWMVDGRWMFGSGCKHAAWAMVGVDFDGAGGSGRGQVILSRDQYAILDDWQVMGMSATSSNTIVTEQEVFVPGHRFLDMAELPVLMDGLRGRYEGEGFAWGAQARVLVVTLTSAANALGMARGALECLPEQAAARKPFNLPYESVAAMPSTQVTAGEVRAMVNTAAAVIEGHAAEIDRRSAAGADFSDAEARERTMDIVFATRLCAEAADKVQVCLGSSTVSLKNPVQRFVRDIRVLTTHGAIRFDPVAEISGRDVLGLPPFPMFAGGLPQRG